MKTEYVHPGIKSHTRNKWWFTDHSMWAKKSWSRAAVFLPEHGVALNVRMYIMFSSWVDQSGTGEIQNEPRETSKSTVLSAEQELWLLHPAHMLSYWHHRIDERGYCWSLPLVCTIVPTHPIGLESSVITLWRNDQGAWFLTIYLTCLKDHYYNTTPLDGDVLFL